MSLQASAPWEDMNCKFSSHHSMDKSLQGNMHVSHSTEQSHRGLSVQFHFKHLPPRGLGLQIQLGIEAIKDSLCDVTSSICPREDLDCRFNSDHNMGDASAVFADSVLILISFLEILSYRLVRKSWGRLSPPLMPLLLRMNSAQVIFLGTCTTS